MPLDGAVPCTKLKPIVIRHLFREPAPAVIVDPQSPDGVKTTFVWAFPILAHGYVIGMIITYIIDPEFQTRMSRQFCLIKIYLAFVEITSYSEHRSLFQ